MASKNATTLKRGPIVYGPYQRQSPLWMRLLLTCLVLLVLVSLVAGAVYIIGHALHL